ncbi:MULTISPECIES: hypothetical protein [Brenneria]|uniref:hypothetical protein n=1 Tax=Brenneria TaxID=71655 RepID=UPI00030CED8C|nr:MULTISPECIES: hypothetical protein [Brenneria]
MLLTLQLFHRAANAQQISIEAPGGGAYIWAIVIWTLYSIHNSDPLAWVLMIGGGVVAITVVAARHAQLRWHSARRKLDA